MKTGNELKVDENNNKLYMEKNSGSVQKSPVKQKPVVFEAGSRIKTYEIVRFIASGAYGSVYEVKDANNRKFALKTESTGGESYLRMDYAVIKAVQHLKSAHFCRVHDCWKGDIGVLVMTLTGKNLHEIRQEQKNQKFPIQTAMEIGIQTMNAIQLLHSVGFIHRDIKPANFCSSLEDSKAFVLVDFGMCRRYLDEKGKLRLPRLFAPLKGTIRYASLTSHHGGESSRRDDVESWYYVLVELVVGTLPWYTIDDHILVFYSKHLVRTRDLSLFLSGCPKELIHIMRYIDDLKYFDAPDYGLIRGLLRKALNKALEEKRPEKSEVASELISEATTEVKLQA